MFWDPIFLILFEKMTIEDTISFSLFYTPANEVEGGYTGLRLSVHRAGRPSVRPAVDTCPDNISKTLHHNFIKIYRSVKQDESKT